MRIVRAVAGTLLLVIALPLLMAGAGLWEAARHRDADGAFRAAVERLHTDGTAIVVWDLDGLLRREAAFARGGRTTLRIDVPGRFVGLAPRADVERYLDGAGRLEIERVRLARGPLPVDSRTVDARPADPESVESVDAAGGAEVRPGRPALQGFWRLSRMPAEHRPLAFPPSAVRGQGLALVIMNADAGPEVSAAVTVAVTPGWLDRTTWGVLILGTVLLLLGAVAVGWPRPRRDVVYVVEPAQLPDIAARLGLHPPAAVPAAVPVPVPEVGEELEPSVHLEERPAPQVEPQVEPVPVVPPVRVVQPVAAPQAEAPVRTARAIRLPGKPPVTVHLEWPPAPACAPTPAPIPAPVD
jgi:hypothetical protein